MLGRGTVATSNTEWWFASIVLYCGQQSCCSVTDTCSSFNVMWLCDNLISEQFALSANTLSCWTIECALTRAPEHGLRFHKSIFNHNYFVCLFFEGYETQHCRNATFLSDGRSPCILLWPSLRGPRTLILQTDTSSSLSRAVLHCMMLKVEIQHESVG